MSDPTTPPWHPWCGCYGCRAGERAAKKALLALSNNSKPKETPDA